MRTDLRARLRAETGQSELAPAGIAEVCAEIEAALAVLLAQLTHDHRVNNVRLPWGRTFEVDFELDG